MYCACWHACLLFNWYCLSACIVVIDELIWQNVSAVSHCGRSLKILPTHPPCAHTPHTHVHAHTTHHTIHTHTHTHSLTHIPHTHTHHTHTTHTPHTHTHTHTHTQHYETPTKNTFPIGTLMNLEAAQPTFILIIFIVFPSPLARHFSQRRFWNKVQIKHFLLALKKILRTTCTSHCQEYEMKPEYYYIIQCVCGLQCQAICDHSLWFSNGTIIIKYIIMSSWATP